MVFDRRFRSDLLVRGGSIMVVLDLIWIYILQIGIQQSRLDWILSWDNRKADEHRRTSHRMATFRRFHARSGMHA